METSYQCMQGCGGCGRHFSVLRLDLQGLFFYRDGGGGGGGGCDVLKNLFRKVYC